MSNQRELVAIRTVSMYPKHWDTVEAFAEAQGYGSTSAALRRIIDEWTSLRSRQPNLQLKDPQPA